MNFTKEMDYQALDTNDNSCSQTSGPGELKCEHPSKCFKIAITLN